MLSYSSSLRQVQIIYLKPSKNTAHQWILDCLCTPQWSFYRELPLTDTHHIFLSIIFSCKIFLIEKIQLCEGTAKMSTLFKNLSSIYIEQFLVVSVDSIRGLVKPLKQWESLMHEPRASNSQSCSCLHVNCYSCKQRIWSWNLSLTLGLDICYYARLIPILACECDFHFP